jgi:hypothetical protein
MSLVYYTYIFSHIFIYNDNLFLQKNFNTIIVLKNYPVKFSMDQLLVNFPYTELKDLNLYTNFIRGFVESYILYFLLNIKYYILETFTQKYPYIYDDSIVELIKTFTRNSINFTGYEKALEIFLKCLQKNYYLSYKIIILDIKNVPLIKKEQNTLSMQKLMEKYCIFKHTQKNITKKILFYCPNCTKKEIRDHLLTLKQNERKIIHLKSLNRFVLCERLEDIPIQDNITSTILRCQYLQYGASIYWQKQNLNEFQKYIHYIFHQALCIEDI